MSLSPNRRSLLKAGAFGAAAASLPGLAARAFAQDASAPVALSDRLSVLNVGGANVLHLTGPSGSVLVDSGPAGATDALTAALNGASVKKLFNTHWHAEQTGGNAALRRAGANIVAHKRAYQWMAHPYWVPGELRYEEAREADALPTETFLTSGALDADGERIEYGYMLEAHTDADIYVFFRDADVIAVGDVASPARDIAIDWFTGAWTGARLDAMAHLLEISAPSTRFIPAFGPVMTRDEFQAEHDMLKTLHDSMVVLVRRGYSAEDMHADGVMEPTGRQWADPAKFLYDAAKGLWGHQNALSPDIV